MNPLNIDDKTLQKELGSFVSVLVDIDFTKNLPEEFLIQRERFEFMTYLEYENLPAFCSHCAAVGHDFTRCRLANNADRLLPDQRQPERQQQQHATQQHPRRNQN